MKQLGILSLLAFVSLTNSQSYQFWAINDIFYDPTYNSTGESCLDDVTDRDSQGHYMCDAPWEMVEGAFLKMANQYGTPEFIVWGGANAFHINETKTVLTESLLLEIMTNITELFKKEFPGTQVVPVLGSHDWFPQSQLPADGSTSDDDLYDKYYALWQEWIPDTFKKAGYYSMTLSKDRVNAIVLNTGLYLPQNNAVSGSDPGDQFRWLTDQLKAAKQENKKVHIFTHAPVGSLKAEYDAQLADIFREFSSSIVAVYAGYKGTDQFKLIYDKDGSAVACVLLAPSLSPRPGSDGTPRNPGLRRYTFDMFGMLSDSQQYHLNLAENKDWGSLYSYSSFAMVDVNATNLHKLMKKMEVYGSQEFHDYYRYEHVGIGLPYFTPCGCECKFTEICAINNVDQNDYQECVGQASVTCGAGQRSTSVVLMFLLFVISKIIHL